jgi:hypothetical protein
MTGPGKGLNACAVVSTDTTNIHKNGTTMMMEPMMSITWSTTVEAVSGGFSCAVSARVAAFAVLLSTACCSICSLLLLHK